MKEKSQSSSTKIVLFFGLGVLLSIIYTNAFGVNFFQFLINPFSYLGVLFLILLTLFISIYVLNALFGGGFKIGRLFQGRDFQLVISRMKPSDYLNLSLIIIELILVLYFFVNKSFLWFIFLLISVFHMIRFSGRSEDHGDRE